MIEINPIAYTPYEHKYLTLYNTRLDWEDDKDRFEEVNISAIKTDNVTEIYHPSTRHNPWDDYLYEMIAYSHDEEERTMFLEILWGYFGWEWKDYEYTPEDAELDDDNNPIPVTLKGGNLYKIKELTEVPSIPDGYRLQHINNFLNSLDRITHVNWFDVSNIKVANEAFSRNNKMDSNLTIDILEFPELEVAQKMFVYQSLLLNEGEELYFPKLTDAYKMFMRLPFRDTTRFKLKFDKLTSLKSMFIGRIQGTLSINLNDLIEEESLKRILDFSYLFAVSSIFSDNWSVDENDNRNAYVSADLRGNINDSIDLSYMFSLNETNEDFYHGTSKTKLNINLRFDKPANLDYIFLLASRVPDDISGSTNIDDVSTVFSSYRKAVKKINVSFTDEEKALITNLNNAFYGCYFYDDASAPITEWNGHSTENDIYRGCVIKHDFNYDFSPTHILNPNIRLFNSCSFTSNLTFNNLKYLRYLILNRLTFPSNYYLDLDLCDPSISYYPSYVNDDLKEYLRGYRMIDMGSCKGLTRIKPLNIYIIASHAHGGINWSGSVFGSCPDLDFPSTSEEDAVHLYIKPWYTRSTTSDQYIYMNNCTSMTETPYFHADFTTLKNPEGTLYGGLFSLYLNNCTNLRIFHGEHITVDNTIPINWTLLYNSWLSLSGCTNLEVFKLGVCKGMSINLTGCYELAKTEESRQIFENSIMSLESIYYIIILRQVFDRLSDECKAIIRGEGNKVKARTIIEDGV